MKRSKGIGFVCFFFLSVWTGTGQCQEKYPSRPIELVTPWAAGGSGDVYTRLFSEDLSRLLKVPVNVVNRAGSTGVQGTSYVVRSKKDGYTLLSGGGAAISFMPVLSKEVTYDPLKDLIPLGDFVSVPSVFAVRSDSPLKTLEELIEYARQNPGKLKNAAGGLGTPSYFNLEILCAKNKVKITSIPFASGGEALPALLGGHVDMSSNTITTLGPQIKAGKLRALAITSKIRDPDYPDIPTTSELGYPEANFLVWLGVFAPAGVSKTVLDVLIPSLENVFKNPEVVQRAKKARFSVEYKGPEEFRKMIESEIETIKKVAKSAGLKKE